MAESIRRVAGDSNVRTTVERRKSPRTPLLVRVRYATVDALFSDFASNVNEGGIFIETDEPPPPETRVVLQFQLPESAEPIRTEGRVAWTRSDTEDGPSGMGVEFDDLVPADRARINELVRRLRSADTAAEAASGPKR